MPLRISIRLFYVRRFFLHSPSLPFPALIPELERRIAARFYTNAFFPKSRIARVKREGLLGREDGRISKPESQTGTRLYIQENSELRGSQRRRGPIEETGGAGCSDSEVANRLLCSFSGEWLSSPKFLYSAIQIILYRKKVDFFLHSSKTENSIAGEALVVAGGGGKAFSGPVNGES
ncbi:hypothetical protein VNO77_46233 [Canavalia gladiata]|uniref:Uncharacterized protein n=1 Tax=Canavalia gladiata TaxID=3824 RepID=A0AAN9JHH1_CANGL